MTGATEELLKMNEGTDFYNKKLCYIILQRIQAIHGNCYNL